MRIVLLQASGLGLDMAPRFDVNAHCRRSIPLDLKQQSSIDALLRMLDTAHMLGEGLRPGMLEGLRVAVLRVRNRGLWSASSLASRVGCWSSQ